MGLWHFFICLISASWAPEIFPNLPRHDAVFQQLVLQLTV
jgi:hypothetical protein